jgi:hypothetical protein
LDCSGPTTSLKPLQHVLKSFGLLNIHPCTHSIEAARFLQVYYNKHVNI